MRRSKLLKAGRFGDFLRSTLSWWRSATISASSACTTRHVKRLSREFPADEYHQQQ
jgi:hypothetical protein